jgi:hypothetical protein
VSISESDAVEKLFMEFVIGIDTCSVNKCTQGEVIHSSNYCKTEMQITLTALMLGEGAMDGTSEELGIHETLGASVS